MVKQQATMPILAFCNSPEAASNHANFGILQFPGSSSPYKLLADRSNEILNKNVSSNCVRSMHRLLYVTEALAVIHGLRFALDLDCMHVVLESDSLTVIPKLKSGVDDCSLLRPYIADAQSVAQTFFSCQFSFTPRSGNKVAHCLAHLGQESAVVSYWVEEVPPQASTLVQADRRCSKPP
ncbi:hypothetical protein V6N13_101178 [Hibiscus sabdariffa]|uniref:RNase H type-1 domain-containing protein n=1 Tax=Hibiscus sabdariffa TaxID=183260 RepID=A0ABR2QKL1_9ROSI